jgi:hypothetical protein
MNDTLDLFSIKFPGQVMLSPREIARAIYGDEKATKKRIEGVRKMLDNGTLCPDLRKAPNEGRWLIPIAALARALEKRYADTVSSAPLVVHHRRRGRKMTNLGPRMFR